MTPAGMSRVAFTGDSPEKQRVGLIGHRHGAADQAWKRAPKSTDFTISSPKNSTLTYRVYSRTILISWIDLQSSALLTI
jgi:hypothetical protein